MIDKKAELLNCGKKLFSSKGFKDTNVSEITKMANMATGTFYNYYSSKDKLFMDIFLEENSKLKNCIMNSIDINAAPIDVMKKMMFLNYQGMCSNPILNEWNNKDVFIRLEQLYREENGTDNLDFLYDNFLEIVRKWQNDGKIRSDIDAEMIMAMFYALINVENHKEEIGIQYFPKVLDYLANFTMKCLTDYDNKDK